MAPLGPAQEQHLVVGWLWAGFPLPDDSGWARLIPQPCLTDSHTQHSATQTSTVKGKIPEAIRDFLETTYLRFRPCGGTGSPTCRSSEAGWRGRGAEWGSPSCLRLSIPLAGPGLGAEFLSTEASREAASGAPSAAAGRGPERLCEAVRVRGLTAGGDAVLFVGGAGRGGAQAAGLPAAAGRVGARVPPFRPRALCAAFAAAAAFRPARSAGVTVAASHLLAALAAPEPAMSGPNGDLGMPVEAGAEGEDDSFGEAGDSGGTAEGTFALPGVPLGKGIGSGIGA